MMIMIIIMLTTLIILRLKIRIILTIIFSIFRYFSLLLLLWMVSFGLVVFYVHTFHHRVMKKHSVNIQLKPTLRKAAAEPFPSNGSQGDPPAAAKPSDPVPCQCKLRNLTSRLLYEAQLSLPVSWLNLTSREVLERTHPNLPVNMYDEVVDVKWCQLLPTLNVCVFFARFVCVVLGFDGVVFWFW